MVFIVSVAVPATDRGDGVEEGHYVGACVAGGRRRQEVDVGEDTEGDEAREHGGIGVGINHPVIPGHCNRH